MPSTSIYSAGSECHNSHLCAAPASAQRPPLCSACPAWLAVPGPTTRLAAIDAR